MTSKKRKVVKDLAYSWLIFIGMIVLIIIEQGLDFPWNRITNGLWVLGAVTLIFFMGRGFYRLFQYQRSRK